MIIPSLPADLYHDNKLIGCVYARQSASSRLYIIDIDPRALIPCPKAQNPNVMSDEDFQSLGQSIDKLEFGQSVAVGIPWSPKEQVAIRSGAVHLLNPMSVFDGTHRLEHALLGNLERIPAIFARPSARRGGGVVYQAMLSVSVKIEARRGFAERGEDTAA
jgi:hypothetical protein